MATGAIGSIGSAVASGGVIPNSPLSAPDNAIEGFQNLLANAITKLEQGQAETDQVVSQLAAGVPLDLHTVALAVEENSLNFELAMQVRNKLVEAYQEVVRMQV